MARSAATLDSFNAIAEPKRRQVIETLAKHGGAELPVNDLAASLGWPQPMISKHLAVLKEVGLVSMRQDGRRRLYRLNGEALKPIHEWASRFERFWTRQIDRIKEAAERKAQQQQRQPKHPPH